MHRPRTRPRRRTPSVSARASGTAQGQAGRTRVADRRRSLAGRGLLSLRGHGLRGGGPVEDARGSGRMPRSGTKVCRQGSTTAASGRGGFVTAPPGRGRDASAGGTTIATAAARAEPTAATSGPRSAGPAKVATAWFRFFADRLAASSGSRRAGPRAARFPGSSHAVRAGMAGAACWHNTDRAGMPAGVIVLPVSGRHRDLR